MTKGKGAGDPPPVSAGEVRELLLKHLGDEAPVDLMEIPFLVRRVNKAISTGKLPIDSSGRTWNTHPDVAAIYKAQRTLAKLLPPVLTDAYVTLAELRVRAGGRPYSELDAFEQQLARARRLLDAVNATIPDIPNPPPSLTRKQDVRSEWYPTARMFAALIEGGYQQAGGEPPSRLSQSSPLVLAVQALLEWIGQRHGGDNIRQALGKSPG